ncbi:MAG: stilbene synthase [Candidatus Kapaibacterium sp.]|nr:MAG: stilbene synthase [Candidatus Kapabacteria bacterium]
MHPPAFPYQANIVGLGTALPPHKVQQADVKNLVYALFSKEYRGLERLLPVFENTQIQSRYFSKPLEWFKKQVSFVESSAAYVETASELCFQAAAEAMRNAGLQASDIGMVVVVSTTGISTPSLDAKLIQRLKLSHTTRRLPIWGLGCAGGVAGLARAAELCSVLPPNTYLLMVAVELCSLTFQRNDITKSNIVASSLFADGAAAAILKDEGRGMRDEGKSAQESRSQPTNPPAILNSYSFLFDDSEDIMGWDILESGLKVRFSRDIPTFIAEHLPQRLQEACAAWGLEREQIRRFVVHAGGAKVLNAYHTALGIPQKELEAAYTVLRGHGNMSSVSVLFALQEYCRTNEANGDFGVMMALGPGFSAEFVLFRW